MPRDVFRLAYRARMSAEEAEVGELTLYGEIVQDMGKFWKEWFPDDKCAADFDRDIKGLKEQGAKRLKLRINSPGGVVTEAVAMRGILSGAGFENIDIRIEGLCASAATIIATIPGARVEITPGSEYMIHNPWTFALGNANELEKEIGHLRQIEDTARAFYAQKTGLDDANLKDMMDEETWLKAEDAVKLGFCDALADDGVNATPAAACVTPGVMAVMKGLYRDVPEDIGVREENGEDVRPLPAAAAATLPNGGGLLGDEVSDETPDAGVSTEIQVHEEGQTMEIRELTVEQLRAENPALVEQIGQAAVAADAQRREDIDAITPPVAAYRQMADEAKRNGTSLLDYQKSLVAAMRQRGADWQEARREETAPAANVTGGASGEDALNEDEALKAAAESVAKYAKAYGGNAEGTMF